MTQLVLDDNSSSSFFAVPSAHLRTFGAFTLALAAGSLHNPWVCFPVQTVNTLDLGSVSVATRRRRVKMKALYPGIMPALAGTLFPFAPVRSRGAIRGSKGAVGRTM